MASTITLVTSMDSYVAVDGAEDVTAVAWLQLPISSEGDEVFAAVELVVAGDAPVDTDRGIQLAAGQTILADKLQAMWPAGGVYARLAAGSIPCEVAVEGLAA